MRYSFGGDTGQTYEQLQRRRAVAAAMMQQQRAPQNVGEGISSAAKSIAGALIARRADKLDAANREMHNAKWSSKWPGVASAMMGGSTPGFAADGGGQGFEDPEAAARIRSGLVSRGLPEHIADGFVMNFQDESGLNPGINEIEPIVPGSRGGFGLSQWTGPRRKELEAFAAAQGKPVNDVDLQLDFLMQELGGSERAAFQKIAGTQDAGSAAAAIATHFLRPAQEHLDRRVAKYTGGAAPQNAAASIAQVMQMAELASSPYASPGQKAVAEALMGRAMQANDPMRQLQMQNLQSQIDARNNAAPPERKTAKDANGRLRYLDTGELVFPDVEYTPEPVNMKGEQDLRKEFNSLPSVKDFSTQAGAFGRIVASAKDPTPAGDLALIFNYMKVLDPGSVVRESEFATAESAAAWLQESEQAGVVVPRPIASAIRKMATGERLSDEQRGDFVGRASMLYQQAEAQHEDIAQQYRVNAQSYDLDPDRSVTDHRYTQRGAPLWSERPQGRPGGEEAPQQDAVAETSEPVTISGDDDYNKLPSGAVFIGPDGVTRRKP